MPLDASTLSDERIVKAVGLVEKAAYESPDGAPIVQLHCRRGTDKRTGVGYVLIEVNCKFKFDELENGGHIDAVDSKR